MSCVFVQFVNQLSVMCPALPEIMSVSSIPEALLDHSVHGKLGDLALCCELLTKVTLQPPKLQNGLHIRNM